MTPQLKYWVTAMYLFKIPLELEAQWFSQPYFLDLLPRSLLLLLSSHSESTLPRASRTSKP
jgi:hypothetical protein